MRKAGIITDLHAGARSEASVFLDLHKDMLECFFEDMKARDIKEIWFGGDFFDNRKFISSGLLKWVRHNWLERVREAGIKVYFIIGNHDTKYKSTNTPNTPKEYFGHDANHIIFDDDIYVHKFGKHRVAFVPWLSPENTQKNLEILEKECFDVVLGHFDIAGMLFQANQVSEHGLDKSVFRNHGMVLSGHFHKKSSDGNIHYLGNPLPTTWAESIDPHGWHIIDEDLNLEFVEYKQNIYQSIDIDTVDPINIEYNGAKFVSLNIYKKNEFHFQNYLEYLRQFDIVHTRIQDYTSIADTSDAVDISEEELRDDLITMIKNHIDQISDSLDVPIKELKELMDDLYEESNQMGKLAE